MRNLLNYRTILLWCFVIGAFSFVTFEGKMRSLSFDPDAGLVPSLSQNATIIVSSNNAQSKLLADDNLSTAWQSDAPLPTGFVNKSSQNILLNKRPSQPAVLISNTLFTDADLNTQSNIPLDKGLASVEFPINQAFFSVSLKCQTRSVIHIYARQAGKEDRLIGSYHSDDNFQFKRIEQPIENISSIVLVAESAFNLFEIAALSETPKESAVLKLPREATIGLIKTRHWAGEQAAIATKVYLSKDGQHWNKVKELVPTAVNEVTFNFPPQRATYVKIEHHLAPKDWNKVYLWEIKVYDQFGHFGQKPLANPSAVNLKELLGVNGYWSWGTNQYSHLLAEDEGPRQFQNMFSHARNYHDLTWDINEPGQLIDFSQMKTEGTPAKEWVNWDLEYSEWKRAGLDIQASLQFYRFKPEQWRNPSQSAFQYAYAYSKHFGISQGNGLVCSIEAGNEPWEYPADLYQKILEGVYKGAKKADPNIEVLPCALQAADPSMEQTTIFRNYIGARITEVMAAKLDGLNTHVYSYITTDQGQRKAIYPEHPLSSFWELNNFVSWRDRNMPGKKIYLSEWGWDSDGGGENCTHDECVSEYAAAVYAVRGALIAARMGIERATWYFYANVGATSSLYTRSGLLASGEQQFAKKKAYNNLAALTNLAGTSYFHKVIQEDEKAWIYLLCDKDNQATFLIGWRPIDGDDQETLLVEWAGNKDIVQAVRLDGQSQTGTPLKRPLKNKGYYNLPLSATPTLFYLK